MSAITEIKGNVAIVTLTGTLDFSTQNDMQAAIEKALAADQAGDIQVNMADLIFMDSYVIRALLNLQEKANANGRTLTLSNCSSIIREILSIGGFDKIFKIL